VWVSWGKFPPRVTLNSEPGVSCLALNAPGSVISDQVITTAVEGENILIYFIFIFIFNIYTFIFIITAIKIFSFI
jgi:hypothetical protein